MNEHPRFSASTLPGRSFLCLILILLVAPAAAGQAVTLTMATDVVPDRDGGDADSRPELEIRLFIRANAPFGLGTTQLIFTFNTTALDFPASPVAGTDYIFQNFHGAQASLGGGVAFYNVHTVTNSGAANEAQVNLALATANDGQAVATTDTEIVRLYMKIADPGTTLDLAWDDNNSQVFSEDNNTQVGRDAGAVTYDDPGGSPLPVELTTFEARADGEAVTLSWTTASETNNAGFEVEWKQARMDEWMSVAFVEGYGTTTEAQRYEYRVDGLNPGRHTFRLKQVDFDGAFAFSPQVEVTVELAEAFRLSPAYPNPFNPQTAFTLAVASAQRVNVEVYNLLGQRVAMLYQGKMETNETRRFVFEAGEHASGLYVIRARGERFVATQRVTLLK